MRTRIAPTPSGYLHVGNAVNCAVIHVFAVTHSAELLLRIDDMDAPRVRPEYVADIHRVLAWLEITPTGTVSASDTAAYRDALDALDTFNCRCSRTTGACSCAGRNFPLVPRESAAKLRLGDTDVVLWRRDDLPSYHLANVVEDDRMGITHVLRGDDLRESSRIHRMLCERLGTVPPVYLHHELITDAGGAKLSKSTLRSGQPMLCDDALRTWVRTQAANLTLS